MSLFDQLGGQQPQNPQQMLAALKANPATMLKQHGMIVPDGMTDAHQIVQHLLQSGQLPQARLQQLMRYMPRR